ncbi:MAG: hypothetical protein ACTSX4_01780, partial [Candidatus Helarchaeota archaeon]
MIQESSLEEQLDPRTVVEHARQINSSQGIVSFYYNDTNSTTIGQAFNDLAPNWESNQVEVSIENLYENRSWLKDPGFEYDGNWTAHKIGKVDQYGNWTYQIEDGVGVNSSRGAHIILNCSTSPTDNGLYSSTREAWFEQEVIINRTD